MQIHTLQAGIIAAQRKSAISSILTGVAPVDESQHPRFYGKCEKQNFNVAYIKTYKTGSSTLAGIFYRYFNIHTKI